MVGAHKSQIVRVEGSSIAFKRAFAADSVRRSASSMTTTRYVATDGVQAARVMSSRISSILIERPSVWISSTSAWAPDWAVRQSTQLPQPPDGQTKEAAKASAALDRPDPGGPVKSQAWVISWDSSVLSRDAVTARCRIATVSP